MIITLTRGFLLLGLHLYLGSVVIMGDLSFYMSNPVRHPALYFCYQIYERNIMLGIIVAVLPESNARDLRVPLAGSLDEATTCN